MAEPVQEMHDIAAAALAGAERGLREGVSFSASVKPIVVVNVAWSFMGREFAIGSRVPENHGHSLLADSLRQSADEAEEADHA